MTKALLQDGEGTCATIAKMPAQQHQRHLNNSNDASAMMAKMPA
jgi:hypothetical protein